MRCDTNIIQMPCEMLYEYCTNVVQESVVYVPHSINPMMMSIRGHHATFRKWILPQGCSATGGSGRFALGGYDFPSRTTLGLHVQRFFSGTWSSKAGIWLPHPHQDCFSEEVHLSVTWPCFARLWGKAGTHCRCRTSLSCTWLDGWFEYCFCVSWCHLFRRRFQTFGRKTL